MRVYKHHCCRLIANTNLRCSKFFGAKGGPPPQQTKLAFSSKAAKAEPSCEPEEDVSSKENSDPEKGTPSLAPPVLCALETSLTATGTDSKKRVRAKTSVNGDERKTVAADDDDDVPVAKRPRRTRVKVEDDEDEAEDVPPKQEPPSSSVVKTEVSAEPEAKSKSSMVSRGKKQAVELQSSDAEKDESAEAASASGSEAEDDDADVDEKPEVVAKAREKVQTKLQSKAKDPYPDWKPGTPVPYAALCTTFSLVEMTTKRLIIMEHCSLFLRQVMRLTPDELLPTVLLMINKLAPDYAGIELGIGESLIMKAIGETTGRSLQVIKADQKEIGDLGLVAVKSRSTQPTMFKPKPLTVKGVHQGLMNIATVSGHGAQGKKVDLIKKLLSSADAHNTGKIDISKDKGGPSEAKYIVRFLEGKLRLGLAERTVLVSLAQAAVSHEAEARGTVPSTSDMEKGEAMLKTVYRCVPPGAF
jgi:DNA ligase 1